uniref:Uncharacterized protein n=1 Tax=Arundo donax TaxID=35708 RepID=A0A0A8Y0H8_ARUDO
MSCHHFFLTHQVFPLMLSSRFLIQYETSRVCQVNIFLKRLKIMACISSHINC